MCRILLTIFQSTLPREERRNCRMQIVTDWRISIHASTRGATIRGFFNRVIHMISIHASTRGATGAGWHRGQSQQRFQSTLPREERQRRRFQGGNKTVISIHASTRGATLKDKDGNYILQFQSTLPREERPLKRWQVLKRHCNFNPSFHERSDTSIPSISTLPANFNPRFHERSDGLMRPHAKLFFYFNPRFHERSDRNSSYSSHQSTISIHASTRGATKELRAVKSTQGYFNPRFHERSDGHWCSINQSIHNFNPRFHERSDKECDCLF